ncbi:uncharacterized protein [Aegilops tauschii subsp. strangulata]|uniref:uncharacterized protein n=1 Tax=Aegilops tauschii subsp. strangulata TaxID=200361 RepID=UPI001ABC866F|nr:uncharacterized protein LOC120963855 [Aegilops tauschii subsp. strangulata]
MEDAGMEFLLDAVDRFPLREEFADSHEHPDPVPLALLANPGSEVAAPADSSTGSGCAQQLSVKVNGSARDGVWRRPDSSPTRSAQSTDRINAQAPGWTKRLRLGSAPPDRTQCPSRMSAMEQSIHKYAEKPTKSVIRHASKIYTRAMFEEFGRLLIEATTYNVTEKEKMRKYVTVHNNAAKREKWSRVEYEVNVTEDKQSIHVNVVGSSTLECCAAMY